MSTHSRSMAGQKAIPTVALFDAGEFRDGAAWRTVVTAARIYLVLLLGLVAIGLVPALFGWHGSVVSNDAMRPQLSPGDLALISPPAQDAPIAVGRIIQFTSPSTEGADTSPVHMHRVVAVNPDGSYSTAGDANADGQVAPVKPSQVTGEVRMRVRFIGLPSYWLSTGNGGALTAWVVLTVAALLVLVVDRPAGPFRPAATDGVDGRPTRASTARRSAL